MRCAFKDDSFSGGVREVFPVDTTFSGWRMSVKFYTEYDCNTHLSEWKVTPELMEFLHDEGIELFCDWGSGVQ